MFKFLIDDKHCLHIKQIGMFIAYYTNYNIKIKIKFSSYKLPFFNNDIGIKAK